MPLQPKEAADNALTRARAILQYSQEYKMADELSDDLVRNALVMGIAALDTYLHAAVMRKLTAWKPKSALGRLDIRFDELCDLIEQATKEKAANPKTRQWEKVKGALHERLLKTSFQSSAQVGTAMKMCGVNNGWHKIEKQRGIKAASLKSRLDQVVRRRNVIVHESDQKRAKRPRVVRLLPVDPGRVKRDLTWLERLIEAIDDVVKP